MTPDEAKQVLAAARQSAQFNQWEDVDHLLRPVYDRQLLTGPDQGDAAYLLGMAYLHGGTWDAARIFLTEASTTASAADRAEATTHLAEITRHEAAIRAESDGLVEQGEAAAVLAAGNDALDRGDLDAAYEQYWAAYDGQADTGARAKAALGIATVWAHRGLHPGRAVRALRRRHRSTRTGGGRDHAAGLGEGATGGVDRRRRRHHRG